MNEQDYYKAVDFGMEYLEHHGILGMKWGKRHGPPYPISGEAKTEFKAQKAAGEMKKALSTSPIKYATDSMKKNRKTVDDFTQEELEQAIKIMDKKNRYLEQKNRLWKNKVSTIERGKVPLEVIAGYTAVSLSIIKNMIRLYQYINKGV